MIYWLHSLLGLGLVLLQSVVLPAVFPLIGYYDFIIPVVVYLAVFRKGQEALIMILLLGLVMDSITGGALGLHLFTYLWIFAGLRLIITYVDKNNMVLQLGAVLAGILLEHGFFWVAGVLPDRSLPGEGVSLAGRVIRQLVLATLTAPLFLLWWHDFVDRLPHMLSRIGKKLTTEFYLD